MTQKTVEQLLDEALSAFDDRANDATGHVRRAIRIATKRQDFPALIRLLPETFDLSPRTKIDVPAFVEAQTSLAALIGREDADKQVAQIVLRWQRDRTAGKDKMYGQSISQLEAQLRQVAETVQHYRTPPENLTPIDTYFVLEKNEKVATELIPVQTGLEQVVERVRQAVYDLLLDMERQIESGRRRPSVFDRGRDYVENSLAKRAPDALVKLRAAEEALDRGTPEDLAQALTSCRRMIKSLADALYPATDAAIKGDDGKERIMSDDLYKNRLLQFVVENADGRTHKKLTQETFRSLGDRLERLNELSSKGVHLDVTWAEAETCVMWTCLTTADFLRIADGSSARINVED